MPLFYRAIQSPMANKQGVKTWHPSLVKVGKTVSTQELAKEIAERSSLTTGDVHNVVRNLMAVMRQELLNSRTVRLDGLGTFTMIARSSGKGVEKASEVGPQQIIALKCQFTPEYKRSAAFGTTRALLEGVQFADADLLKAYGERGEEPDEDGGDEPLG